MLQKRSRFTIRNLRSAQSRKNSLNRCGAKEWKSRCGTSLVGSYPIPPISGPTGPAPEQSILDLCRTAQN